MKSANLQRLQYGFNNFDVLADNNPLSKHKLQTNLVKYFFSQINIKLLLIKSNVCMQINTNSRLKLSTINITMPLKNYNLGIFLNYVSLYISCELIYIKLNQIIRHKSIWKSIILNLKPQKLVKGKLRKTQQD